MPALLKPSTKLWLPGQVKSPGPYKIDWSHPLAQGLVFCVVPSGVADAYDLASGNVPTPTFNSATVPAGMTANGPAVQFSNTGDKLVYNHLAQYDVLGDMTIFTRGTWTNTSTFQTVITNSNGNGGTTTPFDIFIGPSQGIVHFIRANTNYVATTGNVDIDTNMHSLGISSLNGSISNLPTLTSFYVDGQLDSPSGGGGGGGTGTPTASGQPYYLGKRVDGATQQFGTLNIACVWNRALSANEHLQLHLDPYCFLLPPEGEMPAIWIPASPPPPPASHLFLTTMGVG